MTEKLSVRLGTWLDEASRLGHSGNTDAEAAERLFDEARNLPLPEEAKYKASLGLGALRGWRTGDYQFQHVRNYMYVLRELVERAAKDAAVARGD